MAEGSVFRLLVMAIAAIALLAAIALFFGPLFNPPQSLYAQLKEKLDIAQNNPGKSIPLEDVSLEQGISLTSASLQNSERLVLFQCNDVSSCCAKESENCDGSMVWSPNSVSVRRKWLTESAVRCNYLKGTNVCTAYFGFQPAQIEIEKVEFSESFDLKRLDDGILGVRVKNVGSLSIAEPVYVSATAYRLQTNPDGTIDKEKVSNTSETIYRLAPRETKTAYPKPGILVSGSYEIVVTVAGEDAGVEEKTIRQNATGTYESACKASSSKDEPQFIDGKCKQRHYCVPNTCEQSFFCKNAWQSQEPTAVWESASAAYAYKILDESACGY